MAGVIPYAVTSMATVVCAFEINHASEAGAGYLMSEKTAEALLHVIEPIQVGYGAVVSYANRPTQLRDGPMLSETARFYPSSGPSTGVWNGPSTVVKWATHVTSSAL